MFNGYKFAQKFNKNNFRWTLDKKIVGLAVALLALIELVILVINQ